jgi:hypothetical protein
LEYGELHWRNRGSSLNLRHFGNQIIWLVLKL